jgi:hypothetical protein
MGVLRMTVLNTRRASSASQRAHPFAPPQRVQINYLVYYRLSASNVDVSSDAYAALWMKWDALGLQQRRTA